MLELGKNCENLSIMIPNFNGERYLAETIRSLQAQIKNISGAQIQILDNCSTDNSEHIARQLWGDRVSFFQHHENIGPIENFNACIAHADNEWIHILHNDDYLLPNAYNEFAECIDHCENTHTDASAVFSRSLFVDENSLWTGVTPILGPNIRGHYSYEPKHWHHCPLQYAGVLVSKQTYNDTGGFNTKRPVVCDWEKWWQLARNRNTFYTNECTSAYRAHPHNASSQLKRTGANISEGLDLLHDIVKSTTSTHDTEQTNSSFFNSLLHMAFSQTQECVQDRSSFLSNLKVIKEFPLSTLKRKLLLKIYIGYLYECSYNIRRKFIGKISIS